MDIIKVTNIGLKITDNITVPALKIVVDNFTGQQSFDAAFQTEVITKAAGMVATTAYFSKGINQELFDKYGNRQNVVLGTNEGFSLSFTAVNRDGSLNSYSSIGSMYLSYRGKRLTRCDVYTGYSDYEYVPLCILVDTNNNLIISESTAMYGAPDLRTNINLGISVSDGVPVAAIGNISDYDLSAITWLGGNGVYTLGNNIESYIVNEIDPAQSDPYAQGGTSGGGGGTGNFDLSSDSVDFPALPTLTAVSTGLVSIYTPTLAQLNALATYLWNADVTTVDWWKKLVANPLDLILGLSIVPVAAPVSGAESVKVGLIDTQVTMNKASTQFVEVPCGSINVTEFYGGALDYAPYRKTSIYLPFIGTRLLSTDDIMGKTVEVKYHVDLLSGALVALVKCGDAVLYQFAGACAVSLPLSGQTFTDTILSTIQLAAAGTAFVATGGFGLTGGAAVAAAAGGGATLAGNVMTSKPQIERAGGVSGAAGQLGTMTPYLIGEIPRQSVPENYNTFVGYPSNIKSTLGDLTGFTSVESIHLQNIPATAAEYDEIERLLKEGVIL